MRQPVKWQVNATPGAANEAVITITAVMEAPWHIYSQDMEEGGPLPTSFRFVPSDSYTLEGTVREITPVVEKFDNTFLMPVRWFEGSEAVFQQRVRLHAPSATVTFEVEFMACTDEECLLPETKKFAVEVTGGTAAKEPQSKKKGKKKAKNRKDCPPEQ